MQQILDSPLALGPGRTPGDNLGSSLLSHRQERKEKKRKEKMRATHTTHVHTYMCTHAQGSRNVEELQVLCTQVRVHSTHTVHTHPFRLPEGVSTWTCACVYEYEHGAWVRGTGYIVLRSHVICAPPSATAKQIPRTSYLYIVSTRYTVHSTS